MNTSVGTYILALLVGAVSLWGSVESAAQETRPTGAYVDSELEASRLAVRTRLGDIFAAQQSNGDIRFKGPDSLLYYHPLLATHALECAAPEDAAFLESAYKALKSYYNYLLVYHDSDGDFLVERASDGSLDATGLEDVGFNAMLALDMLSLSKICLELRKPIDALFWYQGVRTISRRLIEASYDPDAGYFLPTGVNTHRRESLFYGLSALPLYFSDDLGDNIAASVVRNYLLNDHASLPETPSHYVTGLFTDNELLAVDAPTRALRTRLLLGAIERNGLGANIAGRFAAYQSANGDDPEAGGSVDPFERYTRAILATRSEFSPFPNYLELDILDLLVFQKSLLDTENTARFRSAIEDVQTVLSMRPEDSVDRPALDSKTTTASIRQVYFGISSLRAKWKARALFAHNEHTITPGFDVYAAVSGLWDDVIVTLQAAEDIVADENLSASGVTFAANLQRESTAPAEPVPVRFTVSALGNPVAIQSISVMTAQGEEKLLDADPPIEIAAADTVYEFPYSYLATRAPELSIHPFVLSAEIRFADGTFARRHFRRGVYITRPVTFVVRFPNGTSLTQGTVPVDIDVTKHRAFDSLIHARWFSPVGLNPVEGPALEARMPAQTDQMTIRMNVLVPTPCRPGPYPFTLKVLSNGEEAGAVSASLFKHYQWLFAGPFAEKLESLDADYFPETTINLHHRYKGAYGQVTWRPLGTDSFADEGNVLLDGLLPSGSVGFLYTVIRTAAEQTTTVYFRSGSPARLFINGDPLIRVDAGDYNILKRARVELNEGLNDVMVKTLSADEPVLFFQLGDEEDLASVEFNNNLWELVDGYAELAQHSADHGEDGPPQTQRQVTLTYSNPEANSVSVMGTFNGWSPTNTNMRRNNSGNWEISLYLSPGRYAYRFLVNNSREVLDPDRADKEPDGYGGFNSVLYVE